MRRKRIAQEELRAELRGVLGALPSQFRLPLLLLLLNDTLLVELRRLRFRQLLLAPKEVVLVGRAGAKEVVFGLLALRLGDVFEDFVRVDDELRLRRDLPARRQLRVPSRLGRRNLLLRRHRVRDQDRRRTVRKGGGGRRRVGWDGDERVILITIMMLM